MVIINAVKSVMNFFGSVGNIIKTLKDLISGFFNFVKDSIYLIPQPFSNIILVALGVLIAIFIVRAVGELL